MADKVKTISQLKLVAGFIDGDDRVLTVDNPKATITGGEINALDGNCLIGDKAGAAFKEWKSAEIVDTTTTKLDLETA